MARLFCFDISLHAHELVGCVIGLSENPDRNTLADSSYTNLEDDNGLTSFQFNISSWD